ncbi:MAG TPA: hypothetical protein VMW13_05595 [Dehalococcoidales bacterium]|nr:hypothetical protein [Dehalococcoidales bacterium]
MTEESVYQRIDRFHAHLDICSQCRNHCFDLCPTGARLLTEAATGSQGPKIIVGGDEGEWNKGTRVEKTNSDPDDTHRDGAKGTIVGAWGPVPPAFRAESLAKGKMEQDIVFIYFVEWDDMPGLPVAITDCRLKPVKGD